MQSRVSRWMSPPRRMSWWCWAEIWKWRSRLVPLYSGRTRSTVLTSTGSRTRWRSWRTGTPWSTISCRTGESPLTNVVLSTMETCGQYRGIPSIRTALIKEATNKNQDFQNALQSLDFFLMNLPNNSIKPTDDISQIRAKKSSQEVGTV